MHNNIYIGVDVGGTSIKSGCVKNGLLTHKHQRSTPKTENPYQVIQSIADAIQEVWGPGVEAIGIGLPGLLNVETGTIIKTNNIPALNNKVITNPIKERFGVPVFINNDANCFTLGESLFGAGKSFSNQVGITIGTGLGGGIVIKSQIVEGVNSGAGEFGCIPYLDKTFEDYVSSKFFINEFGVSGKELFLSAEKGHEQAQAVFNYFGTHLGRLIEYIQWVLAPEIIILGGSIANAYKYFSVNMFQVLRQNNQESLYNDIEIKQANLKDAGIIGAAALGMTKKPDSNKMYINNL